MNVDDDDDGVMLCKEVNYVILFIYYKWVYMFMNYVKLYIHIL